MIRRAISVVLGIAITAAAVWYLLTPDVLAEMRTVAARARWPALFVALALTAIVQWLRAWRFAIMTNGSFALPEWPLVRIAFQLNFLNFTLPFRLGELGYPVMMRRAYGQPVAAALGVLLLARLFDLFTVGAIFLCMAAALGLAGTAAGSWELAAGAAVLALLPAAMVIGASALRPFLRRIRPQSATLNAAAAALGSGRPQLAAIAVSFAIWLLFGALAYLAAGAVSDDIPPAVAMLGAAAGNVAFALPVNGIGGLGASQAAWAFAVSRAGVPWSDAAVSSIALYAVTLAGALLFGGLAWMTGARSRSDNSAESQTGAQP